MNATSAMPHAAGPSPSLSATDKPRLHPLLTTAAVSVTVFSLLGAATMTGFLPHAQSATPEVQRAVAEGAARVLADRSRATPVNKDNAANPGRVLPEGENCSSCGVVEAVRAVEVEGSGSGLGAVAGGVTGGLAGNQIGNGNGRTAMTLLGAVGGAFAGNAIEKNARKETVYRITVHMADGSYRTLSQSHVPVVGVGDKVRVVNGSVTALP